MTRPSSPFARRIALDEATDQILRTAYRGESPTEVLRRAVKMLAAADGHLDPRGQLKPQLLRQLAGAAKRTRIRSTGPGMAEKAPRKAREPRTRGGRSPVESGAREAATGAATPFVQDQVAKETSA